MTLDTRTTPSAGTTRCALGAAIVALACIAGCAPAASSPPDAGGGADAADPPVDSGAADAARVPIPGQLPDDERLALPVPDAPRYHLPAPFGRELVFGQADAIDECVACQHDTFGIRCSRRGTCPSSDCVLFDGTRVAVGAEADVDVCFHCRCLADGPVCERRTDGDCADGCPYYTAENGMRELVPLGEQRLMSETAFCTCDATVGLSDCRSIYTECEDGTPEGERAPNASGCGSCLCANGYLQCDHRGCPGTE